jgi:hypothetical protein
MIVPDDLRRGAPVRTTVLLLCREGRRGWQPDDGRWMWGLRDACALHGLRGGAVVTVGDDGWEVVGDGRSGRTPSAVPPVAVLPARRRGGAERKPRKADGRASEEKAKRVKSKPGKGRGAARQERERDKPSAPARAVELPASRSFPAAVVPNQLSAENAVFADSAKACPGRSLPERSESTVALRRLPGPADAASATA